VHILVWSAPFQLCYIHAHLLQKRHRADGEINHRKVEVLRDGHWLWVKWLNVTVGDIVKVHNNNFFPADLVILSSR
jgi:phospholipid-transporting ATPase